MADFPNQDLQADEIELLVEGKALTGWESMSVERALGAIAAQFTVAVADRNPYPVRPGQECTLRVAGQVLVTGHVDQLSLSGSARGGRSFQVSGRDRTADLVDCSVLEDPGEWADITLVDLVTALASPFNVPVRSQLTEELAEFFLFRRQPGETAWSAIERACRLRGVLAYSSGDGELLLDLPASSSAAGQLVEGNNLLEWTLEVDHSDRFRDYYVRGQSTDEFAGELAAEVAGQATDPGIDRFRPLLVLAEGALTFEDALDRAAWEATVRASRAARITCRTQGVRQLAGGPLWAVNQLVPVRIDTAAVNRRLLLEHVTFKRDGGGTTSELVLVRPDAYRPQPVVEDFDDLLEGDD